jgi:hypothetical protein
MDSFDNGPDTERTPFTNARAALDTTLDTLGVDEVRVLGRIAERLKFGATQYGQLDLMHDGRPFRTREAREELEDALVYLACAWLKEEGRGS